MTDYLTAVNQRVVIFDGATGTSYQRAGLGSADFGGPEFEGCNELLSITRPDLVAAVHASFLDVGVDVVETNTFGAFAVPLGEYGIAHRTHELNVAAARIAREVVDRFSTPQHPRWVAGSIGPGTKFPSLGDIRYVDLRDAYQEQAAGLLEGGVDLFVIETMFDLLGLKAAMNGCRRAMAAAGRHIPIQTQVTIELTGRMLPGTEIGAALAAIDAMRPDVIGLNCATGPSEMAEHLRYLSAHSRMPIACIPNAGIPSVVDGVMSYDVTPTTLAEYHEWFVRDLGVGVIGGCCGTTPEHLQAVVERCADLTPARRHPVHESGVASTYAFTPLAQDTSFLIIGERTNANGSKKFRDALLAENWDACLDIAKDQIREGAHLLDVCVDYVGRDGVADMDEIARRLATQSSVPVVIDSTEPAVVESALQRLGGRSVLNSANLEDGDAPGSRFDRVMRLAREYGAAVICLLIDESGQARDVEWKLRVAHQIYDLATTRYGLEPGDLVFDALTFPLTTGADDLRGDATATIEAIRRIKAELPGVFTTLGVSNVSFGVASAARHVLNSVFLDECLQAGLDSAIVHAGRITPLSRIPTEQVKACLDLIHDRRHDGVDPLPVFLDMLSGAEVTKAEAEDRSAWPVEQRLTQGIIDGTTERLRPDLDAALTSGRSALDIINEVLLPAMKVVGDRFASGEMQLPFVLQSATAMKAAVAHLEPHLARSDAAGRGTIVLATVKGDVHDIGKNLVDIILTNNGYEVHNLGIKVGISEMITKAAEVGADAIGMSGLLVKSTIIMRENLEELERRGLSHLPVILGGAALTRKYVEQDLRRSYPGPLFYGKDAFAGLRVMEQIAEAKRSGASDPDFGRIAEGRALPPRIAPDASAVTIPARSPAVRTDNGIPTPKRLGPQIARGIPIDDIAAYLNETTLFRNQWRFRPVDAESDDEFRTRIRPVLREQLAAATEAGLLIPQVAYGFFAVNGEGNDLIVWEDESRTRERTRFTFPRQSADPYLCIADFFRPASAEVDYAAFHIVTMGGRISERTTELFAANRYQEYLFLHGLGVEMAEAFAEYWHHRIRVEWGFADEDGPTLHGLFRQQYRGGRYSWGYPACPDLEDNATVARLLDAHRIGVEVGEQTAYQYHPEQTTSAIICHHPQAKYFIARPPRTDS